MDIPQTQPTVASVPESPMEVPGIPTQGEMTQDQMKSNLQEMMSKIDSKYQDFNAQNFALENKDKEQKSQALQQVFDLFQQFGVDPSNVEEVGAFLNKIKEGNPELYQQVEKVLQELIGDEETQEPVQETQEVENQEVPQNGNFDPSTVS